MGKTAKTSRLPTATKLAQPPRRKIEEKVKRTYGGKSIMQPMHGGYRFRRQSVSIKEQKTKFRCSKYSAQKCPAMFYTDRNEEYFIGDLPSAENHTCELLDHTEPEAIRITSKIKETAVIHPVSKSEDILDMVLKGETNLPAKLPKTDSLQRYIRLARNHHRGEQPMEHDEQSNSVYPATCLSISEKPSQDSMDQCTIPQFEKENSVQNKLSSAGESITAELCESTADNAKNFKKTLQKVAIPSRTTNMIVMEYTEIPEISMYQTKNELDSKLPDIEPRDPMLADVNSDNIVFDDNQAMNDEKIQAQLPREITHGIVHHSLCNHEGKNTSKTHEGAWVDDIVTFIELETDENRYGLENERLAHCLNSGPDENEHRAYCPNNLNDAVRFSECFSATHNMVIRDVFLSDAAML